MSVQLFKELIDENGHLEIPAGTRKILPNALMNCEDLTSIVIPEGVTIIGNCAFLGCKNLKHVELPEGLRTIDAYAFMGCTGLESIVIPKGGKIIAHGAFKDCTGLTSVVIPESVNVIGERAFEGCTCLTGNALSLIAAKESDDDAVTISTTACVAGPKGAIVKVLNQAFHLLGSDRIVVEAGDSLDEMNMKINEANDLLMPEDKAGSEFTLLDFLDNYNRMNSLCEEYVLSYTDEENPDGTEDYGVGLIDVTEEGDEYIVRILSRIHECQDSYWDEEWWDWCERMVRLYGCRVVLHKEADGGGIDDKETRMFDLDGDSVKQTILDEFPFKDPNRESKVAPQTEYDDDMPF